MIEWIINIAPSAGMFMLQNFLEGFSMGMGLLPACVAGMCAWILLNKEPVEKKRKR
jgi:hypothetical protein